MRELSEAEEQRARRLHVEAYVFAAHTDFIAGVSEGRSRGERAVAARRQLPLLRAGGGSRRSASTSPGTRRTSRRSRSGTSARCNPRSSPCRRWITGTRSSRRGRSGNVTRGLVARGYDDDAIRGIMGENVLRVFEAGLARKG